MIAKEGCPSCEALKKYFRKKNVNFKYVEMPTNKNKELKPYMVSRLKTIGFNVKETYPMAFRTERHGKLEYVGGYDDVIRMKI